MELQSCAKSSGTAEALALPGSAAAYLLALGIQDGTDEAEAALEELRLRTAIRSGAFVDTFVEELSEEKPGRRSPQKAKEALPPGATDEGRMNNCDKRKLQDCDLLEEKKEGANGARKVR